MTKWNFTTEIKPHPQIGVPHPHVLASIGQLQKMSRARTLSQIIASVPAAVQWKLDEEIDFEHKDIRGQVIPQHLGRIADIMLDWQDAVADSLCLSVTDRNDIAERYPDKPKLQRYY